jgi:hypothetical protein
VEGGDCGGVRGVRRVWGWRFFALFARVVPGDRFAKKLQVLHRGIVSFTHRSSTSAKCCKRIGFIIENIPMSND